jgi:cell division protein FtsB
MLMREYEETISYLFLRLKEKYAIIENLQKQVTDLQKQLEQTKTPSN